ncbi:MAG: hypothetical protein WDW38_003445 [Sanguina aurantia]
MAFAKLAHAYQLALKSHRHDRRVLKSQVDEMHASADILRMNNQTLQDRLVAVEQSAQFDSEEGRRLRDSLWEELQRVHRALGKESTYGEQVREDLKVANSQIALLKAQAAELTSLAPPPDMSGLAICGTDPASLGILLLAGREHTTRIRAFHVVKGGTGVAEPTLQKLFGELRQAELTHSPQAATASPAEVNAQSAAAAAAATQARHDALVADLESRVSEAHKVLARCEGQHTAALAQQSERHSAEMHTLRTTHQRECQQLEEQQRSLGQQLLEAGLLSVRQSARAGELRAVCEAKTTGLDDLRITSANTQRDLEVQLASWQGLLAERSQRLSEQAAETRLAEHRLQQQSQGAGELESRVAQLLQEQASSQRGMEQLDAQLSDSRSEVVALRAAHSIELAQLEERLQRQLLQAEEVHGAPLQQALSVQAGLQLQVACLEEAAVQHPLTLSALQRELAQERGLRAEEASEAQSAHASLQSRLALGRQEAGQRVQQAQQSLDRETAALQERLASQRAAHLQEMLQAGAVQASLKARNAELSIARRGAGEREQALQAEAQAEAARRTSAQRSEVERQAQEALSELRTQLALAEEDLSKEREANEGTMAEYTRSRERLSVAMADVKKLDSQIKVLTDSDASLREELEQTSTHYETQVAALHDQLQLLQQQLSSATATQAAQGAAMQLLQRQLVSTTADAAAAAAAHQQAVLLLQQQLASAMSASIVIPTSITAHSSATEGPAREPNSCSAAGGSTGSDSRQSGSATADAGSAHTSVSTGGKQPGDGKGPSSRTQLAAMRLELELSNAYAHALQAELLVMQSQYEALYSAIETAARHELQACVARRKQRSTNRTSAAAEEQKVFDLLAMIQTPSRNAHTNEAQAAKERCRLLQVAALIKSMALREASMAPPCEPVYVPQEEDPALQFYRDDGTELYPISDSHPYHHYIEDNVWYPGVSRDDMPHVPAAINPHSVSESKVSPSAKAPPHHSQPAHAEEHPSQDQAGQGHATMDDMGGSQADEWCRDVRASLSGSSSSWAGLQQQQAGASEDDPLSIGFEWNIAPSHPVPDFMSGLLSKPADSEDDPSSISAQWDLPPAEDFSKWQF